jgi:hypothetical protein
LRASLRQSGKKPARGALANIADMARLEDRIVAISGFPPLMPNRDSIRTNPSAGLRFSALRDLIVI